MQPISIGYAATPGRGAGAITVTKRNRIAKLSDLSPFWFQKVVEAPGAGARGRKIQEIETEHHGNLAQVVDGEEASGKMRAKISDRHFA